MADRLNGEVISLLDIVPRFEFVDLADGKKLKVYGITVRSFIEIIMRFPKLLEMMKEKKLDLEQLLAGAPGAVAAMIASGCHHDGNLEAETNAAALPLDVQLGILLVIGRCTFVDGFGPFVLKARQAFEAIVEEAGKVSGTLSQLAAKNLGPTPTPQS